MGRGGLSFDIDVPFDQSKSFLFATWSLDQNSMLPFLSLVYFYQYSKLLKLLKVIKITKLFNFKMWNTSIFDISILLHVCMHI